MNEQILARLIRDLINSNTRLPYTKSVRLSQHPNLVFNVKIESEDIRFLSEIQKSRTLNLSTTISALPAGSPCSCCNGSGKAT